MLTPSRPGVYSLMSLVAWSGIAAVRFLLLLLVPAAMEREVTKPIGRDVACNERKGKVSNDISSCTTCYLSASNPSVGQADIFFVSGFEAVGKKDTSSLN